MLGVDGRCPVVTGDDVPFMPDPHLFLAGAEALGWTRPWPLSSVTAWDMLAARRARAVGVGLLTGGFAASELVEGHAFRIYADPLICWNILMSWACASRTDCARSVPSRGLEVPNRVLDRRGLVGLGSCSLHA